MPHLDVNANGAISQNSLFDQSGPHADPDNPTISPFADPQMAFDLSKAETEDVYKQAAARSQPDQPMPEWTGLQGMDSYPIKFTDSEGVTHDNSSLGRITLFDAMKGQYGAQRAEEQARNFARRNSPYWKGDEYMYPEEDGTTPAMHGRGDDEHFNRNLYIARHGGQAEGNGSILPGHDIGVWAKADDDAATIAHELTGHGHMDASPFNGPSAQDYRDPYDFNVWGQHLVKKPEDVFSGLLDRAVEKHGYDIDPVTGDTEFMGPRGASEVWEQLAKRYHALPFEMRANGAVFKNRALQANGFETLKQAGDEKAFLKKLMTDDILHPDNPDHFDIHPTFGVEEYNKLLLSMQSMYHSLDPEGKRKLMRMLMRAGMVAAPAAMAAGQGEDQ
jgi:hypothetical protein